MDGQWVWLFLKHSTICLLKTQFTWWFLALSGLYTSQYIKHEYIEHRHPQSCLELESRTKLQFKKFIHTEEYFYTRQARFCMRRQLKKPRPQTHIQSQYGMEEKNREIASPIFIYSCSRRMGRCCLALPGSRPLAAPRRQAGERRARRWARRRALTGAAPRAAPPTSP